MRSAVAGSAYSMTAAASRTLSTAPAMRSAPRRVPASLSGLNARAWAGTAAPFPTREASIAAKNLVCNSEGVCEEIVPEPECTTDEDCVLEAAGDTDAAICCAGVCRQIECCIDDILTGGDPNDRCPEGSSCFEGICVFACKGDSDCKAGTCCCSDGTCSSECCGGTAPAEPAAPVDTGGVTTLPSTGDRRRRGQPERAARRGNRRGRRGLPGREEVAGRRRGVGQTLSPLKPPLPVRERGLFRAVVRAGRSLPAYPPVHVSRRV